MLRKMVITGERMTEEESEDTDDTGTASIGVESSTDRLESDFTALLSPVRIRSHGKAKKTKDREPFYNGYKGEDVNSY